MSNTTTTITETTEMSSSRRKLSTDSLTTRLWSVMVLRRTSSGSVCSNSASVLRTSLPIFTMSLPGRISIDSSTHLLPLLSMYLSCFGYSRVMRAMSFSRTMLPLASEYTICSATSRSLLYESSTCIGMFRLPVSILPLTAVKPCSARSFRILNGPVPYLASLFWSRYMLICSFCKPYVRRFDIASMRRRRSFRSSMYVFSSRYVFCLLSIVMSRAEVSAMSSTACSASTPAGSWALNACRPCLNLLQKASRSSTLSFSSMNTISMPSLLCVYVFFLFTSL